MLPLPRDAIEQNCSVRAIHGSKEDENLNSESKDCLRTLGTVERGQLIEQMKRILTENLPLDCAVAVAPVKKSSESDDESVSLQGPAPVLIVDDQAFLLDANSSLVKTLGVKADTALGGQIAIDMVAERHHAIMRGEPVQQYKLIFMDFSMPILDGLETTSLIKQFMLDQGLDPCNFATSPYICCLSSYAEQSYITRAMDSGMHDFMTKPAQLKTVKQLLSKLGL